MQKRCKTVLKPLLAVLCATAVAVLGLCGYLSRTLPDTVCASGCKTFTVAGVLPVDLGPDEARPSSAYFRLFGGIPIKSVRVSKAASGEVALLGTPFGIKIFADGVTVVGLGGVDTTAGNQSPAEQAGLAVGDFITSVNGTTVTANSDVSMLVQRSGGQPVTVRYEREGKTYTTTVTPAYSVGEKSYRLGLWVRDSYAGLGTLTFYDPATDMVGGLGHPIADRSTGNAVPVGSGELVAAEILGIEKGKGDTPGELSGRFAANTVGSLLENGETGVYGQPFAPLSSAETVPVALRNEITVGEAKILTTVSGDQPKWYRCEIEKVRIGSTTRSMTVHITDPRLLEQTGGIVQGMSGSPIVQNGKLIGAVTHVFVGDNTRGYGIFADTMLQTAETVANENKLKDAS